MGQKDHLYRCYTNFSTAPSASSAIKPAPLPLGGVGGGPSVWLAEGSEGSLLFPVPPPIHARARDNSHINYLTHTSHTSHTQTPTPNPSRREGSLLGTNGRIYSKTILTPLPSGGVGGRCLGVGRWVCEVWGVWVLFFFSFLYTRTRARPFASRRVLLPYPSVGLSGSSSTKRHPSR